MKSLLNYINEGKRLIDEPEEIIDGMYVTELSFNDDKDGGKIHLSFDATEDEPDGDAFETTFDIVDGKVKMYNGVTYSKKAESALNKFILGKLKECNLNESKRTKEDYEEWKGTMLNIYRKKWRLVDAVWNQIWEDAKREGYTDFLEEDEDDVIDLIETLISNTK